jgi:hypothetical protein
VAAEVADARPVAHGSVSSDGHSLAWIYNGPWTKEQSPITELNCPLCKTACQVRDSLTYAVRCQLHSCHFRLLVASKSDVHHLAIMEQEKRLCGAAWRDRYSYVFNESIPNLFRWTGGRAYTYHDIVREHETLASANNCPLIVSYLKI